MFIYKIEDHVVRFYERNRRFTRRSVFTEDYSRAYKEYAINAPRPKAEGKIGTMLNDFGKFFVIRDESKRKARYFTGDWESIKKGTDILDISPVFSKDICLADFYLDSEAAAETLIGLRNGKLRLSVMPVYLDYQNTLPHQKFVIVCEDKGKSGRKHLNYLSEFNPDKNFMSTCNSHLEGNCARFGFRECLKIIEELKLKFKDSKYSMLHDDGDLPDARSLMKYLKKKKSSFRIALTFKIPAVK